MNGTLHNEIFNEFVNAKFYTKKFYNKINRSISNLNMIPVLEIFFIIPVYEWSSNEVTKYFFFLCHFLKIGANYFSTA